MEIDFYNRLLYTVYSLALTFATNKQGLIVRDKRRSITNKYTAKLSGIALIGSIYLPS